MKPPVEEPRSTLLKRYTEWLVCDRYSLTTLQVYPRVAGRFMDFWGRRALAKVRPSDIRDFLTEMSLRDLSTDVVHRYIWALRSFFDFLCLEGVADTVAPRYVRARPLPARLPRSLSKLNAARLIGAASNARDRALLELFYATGCRISEVIETRMEHVDFAKRMILVKGKGKTRRVFFGPLAKKWLLKYLNGRTTGFLFESQHRV